MPQPSARESLEAQWAVLRPWIDTIPAEAMDRPSVLDGWTVRALVAHVGQVADGNAQTAPSLVSGHDKDRGPLLELVVHGDDLARSVPEVGPPVHDSGSLRAVVKMLLTVLVERAPGRSVEVRVPPFAAVQVVEGTSHSRGTPPNTVETDPLTWVRVACGRRSWDDAIADGSLLVSGVRAGAVAGLMPLL